MPNSIVTKRKDPARTEADGGTCTSHDRPAALPSADAVRGIGNAMSGVDAISSHPWAHVALATGLLLPLSGAAQLPTGGRASSQSFSVSITVKPQFRILESRAVKGGYEYRVWTNMKSVLLKGQEYRFERIGESTVTVPGDRIEQALVDPTAQPQRRPDPQPAMQTPAGQGS